MKVVSDNPERKRPAMTHSRYEARKRGLRFGSWVSTLLRRAHLDERAAMESAAEQLLADQQRLPKETP